MFVALMLACASAVPQAASNRYNVEIVVFRNGGQNAALTDGTPMPAPTGNDIDSAPFAGRKLGGAANQLRKTAGFRVLAHTAWTQAPAGWNSRRGVSAARLGLAAAGIQGKIILERGQYLHLGIDLAIDDGGRRYHISELRRIKANEPQYFDHPSVGVIAVVTTGG